MTHILDELFSFSRALIGSSAAAPWRADSKNVSMSLANIVQVGQKSGNPPGKFPEDFPDFFKRKFLRRKVARIYHLHKQRVIREEVVTTSYNDAH